MKVFTNEFKPISDGMFKFLFGYSKNIRFTEYLLECLFDLDSYTLNNKVEIQNSLVLEKDSYKEHGLETDVRILIKDLNGEDVLVDLEPYTSYDLLGALKSFAYLAKMYVSQFKSGDNFVNAKMLYQFNLIIGQNKYLDSYTMISRNQRQELFKKLDKTLLGNLNKKHIFEYKEIYLSNEKEYHNLSKKCQKLFKFLNSKNMKEAEENAKGGDDIIMEMLNASKKFAEEDDYSWIEELYRKSLIKQQEEHAKQLGIVEGKQIGIIDIAKKMLAKGTNKKYISETTGLSEEELENLSSR